MGSICVAVNPGVCGFDCQVTAEKKAGKIVTISITGSDCKMIQALGSEICEMTMPDFFVPLTRNRIFVSAETAGCHLACPVPVAVVKAVEAAFGLAVPKDVILKIEKG